MTVVGLASIARLRRARKEARMFRSGRRQRRLALVTTSALAIAGLFGAAAEAAPPPGQVSFSAATLFPKFGPNIEDYVVRCNNGPVTVQGHTSGGWEAAIGQHPFRSGDFSEAVPLKSGRAFTIKVRDAGHTQLYRYHVRCLPNDFPAYTFIRYGAGVPEVLLGVSSRLAVRDHLRQARGAGLVVPRSRLGDQGASERERPLEHCRHMGDPPPRREPDPQPLWRWRPARRPRPAATG